MARGTPGSDTFGDIDIENIGQILFGVELFIVGASVTIISGNMVVGPGILLLHGDEFIGFYFTVVVGVDSGAAKLNVAGINIKLLIEYINRMIRLSVTGIVGAEGGGTARITLICLVGITSGLPNIVNHYFATQGAIRDK